MNIDDFERLVMNALLAGDHPDLQALREQYDAASVNRREITTEGFTTFFDVPKSAPGIEHKLLHLDDLQIDLEGGAAPVDTAVEIRNGRLHSLRVSIYVGEFPPSPEIAAAWYYGTKKHAGITDALMRERDLEELLEED